MAREVLVQVLRSLAAEEPTEEPTRLLPLTTGDEAAEYLTGVTTGRFPYDAGRVRAAQALLPHQRPKLQATSISVNGGDAVQLNAPSPEAEHLSRSSTDPMSTLYRPGPSRHPGQVRSRPMIEPPAGLTILGRCGLPRLVWSAKTFVHTNGSACPEGSHPGEGAAARASAVAAPN